MQILWGKNFITGTGKQVKKDQEADENMGTIWDGSWLQEACKDSFCTTSPTGLTGRLHRERREKAASHMT